MKKRGNNIFERRNQTNSLKEKDNISKIACIGNNKKKKRIKNDLNGK